MKKSLCFIVLLTFTASVSAQITSSFDTDADGWTYFSNATSIPVNHQSSGGNPGGYASVTYSSNTSLTTQNWIAPAKFRGNHVVRSLGMNLSFNLQQSQAGTTSGYDVRIENGGTFINFTLPVKPAVAPAWSSYTLSLDENTAWKYNGGAANATRAQIIAILVNVTSVEIRGAYATTASYTSGLDNVILEQRILTPAPVATSLSATSGKPGDVITINGTGFNATPSNNTVSFGKFAGTKAVIQSATATQLEVVVPQGAVYGAITITNTVTGLSSKTLTPFNPVFNGGGRIIPASFRDRFTISTIQIEGWFAGDIDGDGWEDFGVANNNTENAVDIYRNLGLGGTLSAASFAAKVSLAIPPLAGGGVNGAGLWFADLDGDGKLDAISSNKMFIFGAAGFVTLRNTSTPGNISFEAPEYWIGGSDETPIALVADLDGDGRPEIMGGEGAMCGCIRTDFWYNQNLSTPGNIEFTSAIGIFNNSVISGFAVATAGDLDGDGKNELIITHNFGQVSTVLKNTSTPGVPSFTNAFTISTNQYNNSIHVVDMDLDGKNDLVYKISGEAGIHIRLNANSGGALVAADFTSDVIISGDLGTQGAISIADVNGDGKPDIAASDNADVGVYENTFSGGAFDANAFIPAYQVLGAGGSSGAPIVSDLNRDGKPDFLIAGGASITIVENRNIHAPVISLNTVSPLKGAVGSAVSITGNNFSLVPSENKVWFGGVEATVLTSSANLITAEVPAGATHAPVSVTKNGLTSRYHLPFQTTFGSGVTFDNTHFAPPVNYTLTGAIYNIETGDLNRDGKPDIIALGTASNTYAFRNSHTTGPISSTSLIADDTLAGSLNPRLEDLDGDGYLDVMAVNGPLRKNSSSLTEISFLPQVTVPLGASAVDFADFNNDGKIDMTLTTDLSGAGDLIVLENRTNDVPGNFMTGTYGSFSTNFIYNKPSANGATITGDFDGDGFADIVATNPATDNISVYRNLGVLKISPAQFATRADIVVGDSPGRIYKGDFDSDGKLDLMLYHGGTTTTLLAILHNTSTVGTISFTRIDLTNPSAATVAHVADLDGDGRPEIITTSESGNRFSIFKNVHTSGVLTAASFAAPFNTTVTAPRGITTADLNLDGKPEIIITRAANLLVVYENLIPSASITVNSQPAPSAVCDGVTTSFTTAATGTTNITYQWQFSTTLAGTYNDIANGGGYSNVATATLSVNTTGNFGAGFYRANVNGDLAATVFSNAAELTVNAIPTIPTIAITTLGCGPANTTLSPTGAVAGQSYKFYDAATGGTVLSSGLSFTTPSLSVSTTYHISTYNITTLCESTRVPAVVNVSSCNPPVVEATTATAFIEGIVTLDLEELISDPDNNLDPSTLQIITQPASGAPASLNGFVLTIDYSGVPFPGTDNIEIEICDLTGICAQQELTIELNGELEVFNGISPNGDDKNQNFIIQHIDVFEDTRENLVTIFNRWGDVVFEITDYNNDDRAFTGLNKNGKELPAGTYYYKIEFGSGRKSETGYLSLKR